MVGVIEYHRIPGLAWDTRVNRATSRASPYQRVYTPMAPLGSSPLWISLALDWYTSGYLTVCPEHYHHRILIAINVRIHSSVPTGDTPIQGTGILHRTLSHPLNTCPYGILSRPGGHTIYILYYL